MYRPYSLYYSLRRANLIRGIIYSIHASLNVKHGCKHTVAVKINVIKNSHRKPEVTMQWGVYRHTLGSQPTDSYPKLTITSCSEFLHLLNQVASVICSDD